MSNYQGPATLIAGAAQLEVHATLSGSRAGQAEEWGGSAQTDGSSDDFFTALANDSAKLRLPDGREGDVIAKRTAIGSGRLKISGSGPSPF